MRDSSAIIAPAGRTAELPTKRAAADRRRAEGEDFVFDFGDAKEDGVSDERLFADVQEVG